MRDGGSGEIVGCGLNVGHGEIPWYNSSPGTQVVHHQVKSPRLPVGERGGDDVAPLLTAGNVAPPSWELAGTEGVRQT